MIRLKRVYEKPSRLDGSRILVDRLWPRGLTKERAAVTLWLKDVAPSTELRKWFGHAPARWKQFQARYRKELRGKKDSLELLKRKSGASIIEITAATGWQPHSVRGAISGALKKKLGLAVVSQRVKERGRVYRLNRHG